MNSASNLAVKPEPTAANADALVELQNVTIEFSTRAGPVTAVRDISWQLQRGEILGIVGESGSGKSVSSLALIGLLDSNGKIASGRLNYRGHCLGQNRKQDAQLRSSMAMIFQYPRMALNPIRPVGKQIIDVLKAVGIRGSKKDYQQRALTLLEEVKIRDPEQRLHAYPFELSGGMCQRILIAMALAREPKLLIADEPTTGLDVVTQEAILELIVEAARERDMGCMLITHDLGLAAKYCHRIAVMEKGRLVEQGDAHSLFTRPKEYYTRSLIAATPALMTDLDHLRSVIQTERHQ